MELLLLRQQLELRGQRLIDVERAGGGLHHRLPVLDGEEVADLDRLLVLEELNLGTTELISESTRLKIGRLIGARLMVFGSYIIINDTMRMDLHKVEVETGLILKAISKTAPGTDLIQWLKIAEEAAKELF